VYDEVLSFPGIVGLMIGTRPDCLSDEILTLIAGYAERIPELWIELGVQSMNDNSLDFLRRHHDSARSEAAIVAAQQAGIKTCVHMILGIPGEDWQAMMHSADAIARLHPEGIKLHHLHVIRNTALAALHEKNPLPLLSLPSYVSVATDFLERIPGSIMVHRLSGDCHENELLAPLWGQHKGTVIQNIEDEFRRRGTWQGFLKNGGAHKPNSV
jgi:radical SAM protein (TIGR01212 family)